MNAILLNFQQKSFTLKTDNLNEREQIKNDP